MATASDTYRERAVGTGSPKRLAEGQSVGHANVPMFQNPVLNDPRACLSAAMIRNLRLLDQHGPAVKAGSFLGKRHWLLAGDRYSEKTFRPFVTLGLAIELSEGGRTRLQINYTGRTVVELLRTRPVPGAIATDD